METQTTFSGKLLRSVPANCAVGQTSEEQGIKWSYTFGFLSGPAVGKPLDYIVHSPQIEQNINKRLLPFSA